MIVNVRDLSITKGRLGMVVEEHKVLQDDKMTALGAGAQKWR